MAYRNKRGMAWRKHGVASWHSGGGGISGSISMAAIKAWRRRKSAYIVA